jgi:hypothetical protein
MASHILMQHGRMTAPDGEEMTYRVLADTSAIEEAARDIRRLLALLPAASANRFCDLYEAGLPGELVEYVVDAEPVTTGGTFERTLKAVPGPALQDFVSAMRAEAAHVLLTHSESSTVGCSEATVGPVGAGVESAPLTPAEQELKRRLIAACTLTSEELAEKRTRIRAFFAPELAGEQLDELVGGGSCLGGVHSVEQGKAVPHDDGVVLGRENALAHQAVDQLDHEGGQRQHSCGVHSSPLSTTSVGG